MGFPLTMFPVLFAIPRVPAGWRSGRRGSRDTEQKITRPRQLYVGETERHLDGDD